MYDKLFVKEPASVAEDLPPSVEGLCDAFGTQFGSIAAMRSFLDLIWFPKSRAWRYQLNGKSGNSFVLELLFELEFGVPFTTWVDPAVTGNQHARFALFQVRDAGLYSNAMRENDTWQDFTSFSGLTLATVRDPYARALSGFFYLCRSHRLGDRRFLSERLRLNVLAKFNWDIHAGTAEGFDRFLCYLRDYADTVGSEALDAHWRPQVLHIRPDILRPDLIGRTEALGDFAVQVAKRLDRPLPARLDGFERNATDSAKQGGGFYTPERRHIVKTLYAQDFEIFGYAL